MQAIRHLVSKKKKRYIAEGYDLDMTYITDRIVSMGFPSEGREGLYRNPMGEVVRFFDSNHPKRYKVYNLCSERSYDASKFHGSTATYPFDDHNPPPIELIEQFTTDVAAYLGSHKKNVAVIHCKAGKGRTGCMISCLLLKLGECADADEALKLFGDKRTQNGKGVTIPSQIRYVHYYGQMLRATESSPVCTHPVGRSSAHTHSAQRLSRIVMHTVPDYDVGGGCDPFVQIFMNGKKLYQSTPVFGSKGTGSVVLYTGSLILCGDIKVIVLDKDRFSQNKMCFFWFNTCFIKDDRLELVKGDIDKALKDKKCEHFSNDFRMELCFNDKDDQEPAKSMFGGQMFNDLKPQAFVEERVFLKSRPKRKPAANAAAGGGAAGAGSSSSSSSAVAAAGAGAGGGGSGAGASGAAGGGAAGSSAALAAGAGAAGALGAGLAMRRTTRARTVANVADTADPVVADAAEEPAVLGPVAPSNPYVVGGRVWLPHPTECYKRAIISRVTDTEIAVVDDEGEEVVFPKGEGAELPQPDNNDDDGPDDLAELVYMHEPALLRALRVRYERDVVYTFLGRFLVVVNPYQDLPHYTREVEEMYFKAREGSGVHAPHIFASAARAHADLASSRSNQVIVISGESGSGKTTATGHVVSYLSALHRFMGTVEGGAPPRVGGGANDADAHAGIHERLLAAGPILETLGHARTEQNDNASRFGKLVRIRYGTDARIAAADIETYLLEKTRVSHRLPGDRNFHVFHRMLAGLGEQGLAARDLAFTAPTGGGIAAGVGVGVGGVGGKGASRSGTGAAWDKYAYTRGADDGGIDPEQDAAGWRAFDDALGRFGYTETDRSALYDVVAAILHLGDIVITDGSDVVDGNDDDNDEKNKDAEQDNKDSASSGEAVIDPADPHLLSAARLLGVDAAELRRWLMMRRVAVHRGSVYETPLTAHRARAVRDSLSRMVYGALFDSVVRGINAGLSPGAGDSDAKDLPWLGILDMYGFENLERNGFEQLCINYVNEKLQQLFTERVFKGEQEALVAEGLNWSKIDYPDNEQVVTLIEARSGVLGLLDEECVLPQGSESNFVGKLRKNHAANPALDPVDPVDGDGSSRASVFSRRPSGSGVNADGGRASVMAPSNSIVISHYAGDVRYGVDGFLERNNDFVVLEHTRLLAVSTCDLVRGFTGSDSRTGGAGDADAGGQAVVAEAQFNSVASKLRSSLGSLLATLESAECHFVRCVCPNAFKVPIDFIEIEVLRQLRSVGLLETLRIMNATDFPVRMSYRRLWSAYHPLCVSAGAGGVDVADQAALKAACKSLLERYFTHSGNYALGHTRVFLRKAALAHLDYLLTIQLPASAMAVQALFRGYSARKSYARIRRAAKLIQAVAKLRLLGSLAAKSKGTSSSDAVVDKGKEKVDADSTGGAATTTATASPRSTATGEVDPSVAEFAASLRGNASSMGPAPEVPPPPPPCNDVPDDDDNVDSDSDSDSDSDNDSDDEDINGGGGGGNDSGAGPSMTRSKRVITVTANPIAGSEERVLAQSGPVVDKSPSMIVADAGLTGSGATTSASPSSAASSSASSASSSASSASSASSTSADPAATAAVAKPAEPLSEEQATELVALVQQLSATGSPDDLSAALVRIVDASTLSSNQKAILEAGGVQVLIGKLRELWNAEKGNDNAAAAKSLLLDDMRMQAARALANVATLEPSRAEVMALGAMPLCASILAEPTAPVALRRQCARTIGQLCSMEDGIAAVVETPGAVDGLVALLDESCGPEANRVAARAIGLVARVGKNAIAIGQSPRAAPLLAAAAGSSLPQVYVPSLVTIAAMSEFEQNDESLAAAPIAAPLLRCCTGDLGAPLRMYGSRAVRNLLGRGRIMTELMQLSGSEKVLLDMARASEDYVQLNAAVSLARLVSNINYRRNFFEADAQPVLTSLMVSGISHQTRLFAAAACVYLGEMQSRASEELSDSQIHAISVIVSYVPVAKLTVDAIALISELIEDTELVTKLVNSGILQSIIPLFKDENPFARLEALRLISFLADDPRFTKPIEKAKVKKHIRPLTKSNNSEVADAANLALARIKRKGISGRIK